MIASCSKCASNYWGQSTYCTECENGLEPDNEGLACIAENCQVFNKDDQSRCITCLPGFKLTFDSMICVENCPAGSHSVLNGKDCFENCPRVPYGT